MTTLSQMGFIKKKAFQGFLFYPKTPLWQRCHDFLTVIWKKLHCDKRQYNSLTVILGKLARRQKKVRLLNCYLFLWIRADLIYSEWGPITGGISTIWEHLHACRRTFLHTRTHATKTLENPPCPPLPRRFQLRKDVLARIKGGVATKWKKSVAALSHRVPPHMKFWWSSITRWQFFSVLVKKRTWGYGVLFPHP